MKFLPRQGERKKTNKKIPKSAALINAIPDGGVVYEKCFGHFQQLSAVIICWVYGKDLSGGKKDLVYTNLHCGEEHHTETVHNYSGKVLWKRPKYG